MGRLCQDPEMHRTKADTPVTSFTLAVDRDYKPQNGERETDFINVTVWRGTAEFVCKHFTKGRMAIVEGRLQVRDIEDKDGRKRRVYEVVADNVYFGDSRPTVDRFNAYQEPDCDSNSDGDFAEIGEEDGELPF